MRRDVGQGAKGKRQEARGKRRWAMGVERGRGARREARGETKGETRVNVRACAQGSQLYTESPGETQGPTARRGTARAHADRDKVSLQMKLMRVGDLTPLETIFSGNPVLFHSVPVHKLMYTGVVFTALSFLDDVIWDKKHKVRIGPQFSSSGNITSGISERSVILSSSASVKARLYHSRPPLEVACRKQRVVAACGRVSQLRVAVACRSCVSQLCVGRDESWQLGGPRGGRQAAKGLRSATPASRTRSAVALGPREGDPAGVGDGVAVLCLPSLGLFYVAGGLAAFSVSRRRVFGFDRALQCRPPASPPPARFPTAGPCRGPRRRGRVSPHNARETSRFSKYSDFFFFVGVGEFFLCVTGLVDFEQE
ncbi:Protein of unknown function [Gryllus bimaculatus]|nr:Protein of unknown function [Gryllus bimaculatus]